MGAGFEQIGATSVAGLDPALAPPPPFAEPLTPAELRALVQVGENDSDACERLLAQVARSQGALDLAIGDGLATLTVGHRLIALSYSGLRDYAREVLDVEERTAQALARLSRGLRTRPLLRAAVQAGEVRLRHAQTVLPVAVGDAEAAWVARARTETVRALEVAVRAARACGDPEEEWVRFRVRLSDEDRATVDEALRIAGRLMPGSSRAQRLEAMAQEYLSEHSAEAGDDGGGPVGGAFGPDAAARQAALRERLERETERWAFLSQPRDVRAPDGGFEALRSPEEIDGRLRELASLRSAWDEVFGYLAYVVRRSGLWRIAGFQSFEHYCEERLGMSARAVEQRLKLEGRIWQAPALRRAREEGLSYERLRSLARLPDTEITEWVPVARERTVVALRAELEERDEAQMRAARVLRARVPDRAALLLQSAFRAVRAAEERLLDDGRCLVVLARHFVDTWKAHVPPRRTTSQKIRERDGCRCQVPGCSRRAVHTHHIIPRSQGGTDDPENLVALCAFHHLVGIHEGYIRVRGRAPDGLAWELVRVGTG